MPCTSLVFACRWFTGIFCLLERADKLLLLVCSRVNWLFGSVSVLREGQMLENVVGESKLTEGVVSSFPPSAWRKTLSSLNNYFQIYFLAQMIKASVLILIYHILI